MTIADINARKKMMNSAYGPNYRDEVRQQTIDRIRREMSKPRIPVDKVMIVDRSGMDHNIKTGRPPTMKREAREAWERAREEASIDKLFGLSP